MSLPRNMFIGAAVAAAVLLPATAFADAHSEIVNAGMHAGFAAGAPDIAGAHAHAPRRQAVFHQIVLDRRDRA